MKNSIITELKKDLANWERWIGNSFNFTLRNRHECGLNQDIYDTAVLEVSCIDTSSAPYWVAARVSLADQRTVADGEAEEVGELLDSTFFVINYCPYCGNKLSSNAT